MDELTLNLVKLGLDMHTITQRVASRNIAMHGIGDKQSVDFNDEIARIQSLPTDQRLQLVKVLNSNAANLTSHIQTHQHADISLEQEHAISTKAKLEYQALVEALNRKLSISALVYGGQK